MNGDPGSLAGRSIAGLDTAAWDNFEKGTFLTLCPHEAGAHTHRLHTNESVRFTPRRSPTGLTFCPITWCPPFP